VTHLDGVAAAFGPRQESPVSSGPQTAQFDVVFCGTGDSPPDML